MSVNKDSQKAPNLRFKGFTDDWEERKLGEVVSIYSGWSPSNFKQCEFNGDSFIKVDDLNYSTRVQNKSKMTVLENEKFKKIQKGSTIFPKRGAAIVTNKVRMLGKDSYMDTNMMALEPVEVDRHFLYTFIAKTGLFKIADTSTIPQINNKHIEPYKIIVPKQFEQVQIGEFFKLLDNTITLHQRKLDQLNQLKEALLQHMFPGKGETVPKLRFAGFEGDWEERKFDEFLEEFIRKSKLENEFTTLSSTNSGMEVREGRVSGDTNIGYKIIENDDLVLSPQNLWLGNINLNYIGTGLVSPSYKTFKIKNLSSSFLKPQLRSKRLLNQYELASTQGASVVRRNLDMELFYQITLPVPVMQEQYKIGKLFKDLDDYIVLQSQKVNKLKSMKEVLLQNMFI